ncbi:hypothetical protein QCA50_020201 [Cerrena zonata]|uniref:PH domain-containing protein n=1 Tax=Cerrena zonata TaxID=2478898 RepID=A0AAW0FD47_9APHY
MNSYGSVHAVQPMTRASTAQESDQVLTPRDAFGYSQAPRSHQKESNSYRHETYQREDDNDMYRSDSRPPSTKRTGYAQKTLDSEIEINPLGPYFSLPRDPTAEQTPLSRKRTTKDLITRYETMDSSRASSRRSSLASSRATPTRLESPAQKPRKGKSPIRQSFRNLLSVFGKKPKALVREDYYTHANPTTSRNPTNVQPALSRQVSPIDTARANCSTANIIPTTAVICNTPNSLHSGALLYLCRDATPGSFPVWTSCTAVLHPSHILVTWHSSHGNPSTSMVTLAHCTDVKSLALTDLEDTERSLLPSDASITEPKTFELQFEGRAREKFAANSIKERAAWVNAIWDAILQAQERKSYFSSAIGDKPAPILTPEEPKSLPPAPAEFNTPPSSQPTVPTVSVRRDLPALPALVSPVRISLYDAPVSRTNSPHSTLQTPSPARNQSPSIRNLDQRSVVKQRLAQIERTYSEESSQTRLTTPKFRGSYMRTSSPLTPTSSRGGPIMSRQGTIESSTSESIIESYANVGRHQSVSKSSARMMTTPCRRVQSGDSATSSQAPPREDLFSPASKYSTDEKTQPFGVSSRLHTISGLPMQESRPPLIYNLGGVLAQTVTSRESKPLPTPDLEDRLANLQQDVALLTSTRTEASVAKNDGQTEQTLRSIQTTVKGIEGQGTINGQDLTMIRSHVGTILSELRTHAANKHDQDPSVGLMEIEGVSQKLEDLRTALSSQLPELMKKVEMLGTISDVSTSGKGPVVMRNVTPDSASSDNPAVDLAPVEEKLTQLLSLYQTLQTASPGEQGPNEETKNQMEEILELLKTEQAQRATQVEQQTDSVRYLNELNTWLEAFVNHGTSQIDTVVSGVHQLCKELGPVTELQNLTPEGEEGGEPREHSSSLLSDIRRFLIKNQDREESTAVLQASVNGLVAAVQEDLRRNAEARNQFTTESIVGLIERQRQDQERMLRSLQSELANEIRGQRLRFVDAMKEATAINVQIHVEEFKKELTKEVLLMTQEVGRLQRERQTLESQIADLFAFYAKQKQSTGEPAISSAPGVSIPTQRQKVPRALPSMRRRPLPTPSPGPSGRG